MAAIAIFDSGQVQQFLMSAFLTLFLGVGLFVSAGRATTIAFSPKHTFILTAGSWISVCVVCALPFLFNGMSLADALFESVSGLTTTGSTVMSGLDSESRGLLLWRAVLQWVGGIGIIVTSIAILPILRIGGMQLYKSESSDTSEKALSSAAAVAATTLIVYLLLTILCALFYKIAGMSDFDAVSHAMTTLSTGGFSTHDSSMGYFNSFPILWISTVFMISGAVPFVLYINFIKGKFVLGEQVSTFLPALFLGSGALSVFLVLTDKVDMGLVDTFSHVTFNIVSVVTTTGYASTDYTLWGTATALLFLVITFSGGCTGSTSGGLKMMRFIVAAKLLFWQTSKLIYPNGVFSPKYEGQAISQSVFNSVGMFFFVYFSAFVVLSIALAFAGLDLETSISGAATALANVGPGIGTFIGPSGNFSGLPDAAKYLLTAGMLFGRLEFLTLLVLLHPLFWRS
jgi:trk system potassium uptake protein TrkH